MFDGRSELVWNNRLKRVFHSQIKHSCFRVGRKYKIYDLIAKKYCLWKCYIVAIFSTLPRYIINTIKIKKISREGKFSVQSKLYSPNLRQRKVCVWLRSAHCGAAHSRYKLMPVVAAVMFLSRKPLTWHYAADGGQEIKFGCLWVTDVTVLPVGNWLLLPSAG